MSSRTHCIGRPKLHTTDLETLVFGEAEGRVTDEELAMLRADPAVWASTLRRLIAETEAALSSVSRKKGAEEEQAQADLSQERQLLSAALRRLEGDDAPAEPPTDIAPSRPAGAKRAAGAAPAPAPPDRADLNGTAALQASWSKGAVVVWAGNADAAPAAGPEFDRLLAEAGAGAISWKPYRAGVAMPTGERARAVSAPMRDALGWLVGVGAGQLAPDAAPSLRWLGDVTVWATELVANGDMVPTIVRSKRGSASAPKGAGTYRVRWIPAVIDPNRLRVLAARMPAAAAAVEQGAQPMATCRSVLNAAVDTVCRAGASRLVAPASAPVARTREDVCEAVLAGLDGTPFTALDSVAAKVARGLEKWSGPVTEPSGVRLRVRLDAPERDGGWLLTVDAAGVERAPLPVERALATPSRTKAQRVEAELQRLERLLPALRRPTKRRGEVVIDGNEAWQLMTETGAALTSAGFDVLVPRASPRKPKARLQLRAESISKPSVVGARQLSKVQWSVLFDDLELDAAAVAKLAAEARPFVQAKGRWVELDKADLEAAALALTEQSKVTELSGADILQHAVGLGDTAFGGPVLVDGSGWAVDLVRGATENPPEPVTPEKGFKGKLRSYQSESLGWLGFLDRAGLGGILAMDMGLGKTPTLLAHLLATRGDGPVLVVAPPAVLGNWAEEAARFTPKLRVHIHHGGNRADSDELDDVVAGADVVLTTYGTAVRDVEALAAVEWHRVVLDEAQAIRNPASDTAQQLRRIQARFRIALTGTPIENGLGDLWSILDFVNPGLVGPRPAFIAQLSRTSGGAEAPAEAALRALNGLLIFRRTKAEPEIAAELPDKIDEVDHCGMTTEQVGLYQAVLDNLIADGVTDDDASARKGHVLAAITALKQICDHPAAYLHDDTKPLDGRSGKLARLEELTEAVFAAGERMLIFTHFAEWGERMASYLTERTGLNIACYHGGLARGTRDRLVKEFQEGTGPGALVLSIKAGGSGLNLTAANHVVLYDRWWNPAVEDQARDRAWRIGQKNTVICHRLACPGTVDERVEEVVAGKRRIADLVLPARTSLGDLAPDQLRTALGLRPEALVTDVAEAQSSREEGTAA